MKRAHGWAVAAVVMALAYGGCTDKPTEPVSNNGATVVPDGGTPTPVALPDLGLGADGVVRVRK